MSTSALMLCVLLYLDGLRVIWEHKKLYLVINAIFSINGISAYKVFSGERYTCTFVPE